MKRILTAAVLIPLVLVLVFLGPSWLITLVVAAVAALAGWEYLGLAEHSGAKPSRIVVSVAIVALITARLFADSLESFHLEWLHQTEVVFGILAMGLFLYCTFRSPIKRVMADASASIFCLFYVGLTLTTLPALREESNGPSLLLFLLCVVWAGDIAALYVGRAWGRHKLIHAQPEQDLGGCNWVTGGQRAGCGRPAGAGRLARIDEFREALLP
jgi:phosphatidate cytidylyltransferase